MENVLQKSLSLDNGKSVRIGGGSGTSSLLRLFQSTRSEVMMAQTKVVSKEGK